MNNFAWNINEISVCLGSVLVACNFNGSQRDENKIGKIVFHAVTQTLNKRRENGQKCEINENSNWWCFSDKSLSLLQFRKCLKRFYWYYSEDVAKWCTFRKILLQFTPSCYFKFYSILKSIFKSALLNLILTRFCELHTNSTAFHFASPTESNFQVISMRYNQSKYWEH